MDSEKRAGKRVLYSLNFKLSIPKQSHTVNTLSFSLTAALCNTKLWVSILFTAIGLSESMTF